jgi:hypothetical protein
MAALAENVFQNMQIRRERDAVRSLGRGRRLVTSGVQVSSLGSSRIGVVQRATTSSADAQIQEPESEEERRKMKLTVSSSLGLRLEASRCGSARQPGEAAGGGARAADVERPGLWQPSERVAARSPAR